MERGGARAGRHSEIPYVWRVCCSAGVTAGMASLAACSTEKPAWQAWWLAPPGERLGEGEQRVKGPRPAGKPAAGWKACPTKTACPQKGVCDTGADTLVRPYTARHWVAQRAVGKGDQGRLESRPQTRMSAPQQELPTNRARTRTELGRRPEGLPHKQSLPTTELGRRQECLPHNKSCSQTEPGPEQNLAGGREAYPQTEPAHNRTRPQTRMSAPHQNARTSVQVGISS